jgi:acetylxylan esterase
MTDVLLGDYPNIFAAGAAFMGVPFGCFATTDGSMWNSACADGDVSMTAAAWGNLVRNAYPGYTGARPRVQLWHGTADPTLNYNNFGQEILQWTNVLGVSSTPTLTNTPQSGWTHSQYDNSSGTAEVDAYSIAGAGHVLPETGMAVVAIDFFGLNNTAPPTSPPPTTAPPTTAPPTTAPPTTAPPTTAPPTGGSGSCSVADVVDAWNTGLTQQITITNTGSSAINGWKLAFTLGSGQVITSQWNATVTPTSGAVSAVNLSYNVTIPAGGSTGFGFQETQTGNANAPASFTLNGATCTSTVTG